MNSGLGKNGWWGRLAHDLKLIAIAIWRCVQWLVRRWLYGIELLDAERISNMVAVR